MNLVFLPLTTASSRAQRLHDDDVQPATFRTLHDQSRQLGEIGHVKFGNCKSDHLVLAAPKAARSVVRPVVEPFDRIIDAPSNVVADVGISVDYVRHRFGRDAGSCGDVRLGDRHGCIRSSSQKLPS